MGRPRQADDGGLIYHVLNRANARMTIFEKDGDYEAFKRVLEEAVDRTQTGLLACCVMPNADLHRRFFANHGSTGSWPRFPVFSIWSWRTPWDRFSGGLVPAAFPRKFAANGPSV